MRSKKRNVNLDIIRCMALFFVISIHFYLNSGYYNLPVAGTNMYIMTLFRGVFMTCVPLFLLLTGYLMRQKTLSVSYYLKGLKTLITYVLISFLCAVYKACYLKQPMSILYAIKGVLDFSNAPYSWYIEMYIGLFLLIPFLNILWNNIPSKNWKLVFLGTMILLTSASAVVNVYDFTSIAWWGNPAAIDGAFMQLIPDWWTIVYPLTYYFIGCFLNEYNLVLRTSHNLLLLGVSILLSGVYNIWRSRDICFVNGVWQEYGSLLTIFVAVSVFLLFLNLKCDDMPDILRKLLGNMSNLCLGAYLISWIFDNLIYSKLDIVAADGDIRVGYYFVVAPLVYICSLMASAGVNLIYVGLEKCAMKIVHR